MELTQTITAIAQLAYILSSMIGVGLGLRVSEIVEPLRQWRLVAQALLANFVVMPLAAVALAKVLRLDEPLAIGLLLLGTAGGSPFLPTLAKVAKGNLAFAVGLMVMLMVVTVGFLPIVLPLLLQGASVSPWGIAQPLIFQMLLPLAGALAVKANWPDAAAKIKPPLDKLSFVSLLAVVALLTLSNFRSIIGIFGTGGILAGAAFIATGYAAGWLLGGPSAATRPVVGLGTAQRNIAAPLLVASQSLADPNVVVVVVVITIVGLLILMRLARAVGRRPADATRVVEGPI
jgi:BASS family bile acid:Na+ symporter